MKRFKLYIGLLLIPFCVFTSCKEEDPIIDNPSGETIIYTLRINNGDITGAGRYDGIVNQENKTISFLIPAESDIEQLKFDGRLSLNAKLDAESYNFLENSTQTIRVINVENSSEYRVNITMNDPAVAPFVDKMVIVLNDGTEVNAFVSMTDKTVYLKAPNENEVTVKSLSSKPVRATKTLTKISNSKISKVDPGTIQLNFMGLTDEYQISFDDIPTFGADFSKGNIFDFSSNPIGSAIYSDFSAELTRSADFDGNNVLIVSRTGASSAPNPKLFTLSDIMAQNINNPTMLNLTGVAGGTYLVSSGRLAQGRIYICNLTTGLANSAAGKLKLYYWETPTSVPKLVFDFDGSNPVLAGRFGDNMSVDIDANGDGYIFFVEHVSGTQILRLKVTAFETISEPTVLKTPVSAAYFGSYNAVSGSNNEYVYTSTKTPIVLVDRDAKELYKMSADAIPIAGTDARIITFNHERYLIMTTARYAGAPIQTFYVYDISAGGSSTVAALVEFANSDKQPLFSFSLNGLSGDAYSASTGWGVANGKLYTFGAAVKAGFAVFEFPKK